MLWDNPDRIQRMLDRMLERSRFCVSGEGRALVIMAVRDLLAKPVPAPPPQPIYKVEEWQADRRGIVGTIATANTITVAVAAFEAAAAQFPGRRLTLRHGISVLRETKRPEDR